MIFENIVKNIEKIYIFFNFLEISIVFEGDPKNFENVFVLVVL